MANTNISTGAAFNPRGARCSDHPSEIATHCGPCRSELLGGLTVGDEQAGLHVMDADERESRLVARLRRFATNRWKAQCDPEFADATMADVPDLVTADAAVIYAWIDAWNAGADPLPWLAISGPVGTGKTHLEHAVVGAVVTGPNPAECIVTTAPELFDSLRPDAPERGVRLFQYQTTPLLVIDDLGANGHSPWVEERTHLILNYRYSKGLPVVFTTNLEPDELRIAIGGRMASRLRQRCLRVVLEGEDRRKPPTLQGLALATAAAMETSDR